jgi:DNA-binding CsgD family transcriptional regulator
MPPALSLDDLSRLAAATRALLTPLAEPDQGHERWMLDAADAVRRFLGGDHIVVLPPSSRGRYASRDAPDVARDLGTFVREIAADGAHFSDPLLEAWARMRLRLGLEIFTWSDTQHHLEQRGLRMAASPVIGDVVEGRRYRDYAVLVRDLPDGPAMMFALHRQPGGFAFGEHTPALLAALLPSFRAGVDAAYHLASRFAVLEAVAEPLAAFDADARELHRNAALTSLLAAEPERAAVDTAIARLANDLRRLGFPLASDASGWTGPGERTVTTGRGRYVLRGSILPRGAFGAAEALLIGVRAVLPPAPPPPEALQDRLDLTRREGEVALLIAQGLSNQAIADRLYISPRTAKRHTENILAKLDARSRAAITARVLALSG